MAISIKMELICSLKGDLIDIEVDIVIEIDILPQASITSYISTFSNHLKRTNNEISNHLINLFVGIFCL